MPKVKLYVDGTIIEQEVKDHSNLVVLAGIRQFPKLKYGCGMGRCTKCACQVLEGAEALAAPNWKEEKMLGDKVKENYRLACQLTITEDVVLSQENTALEPLKKKASTSAGQ